MTSLWIAAIVMVCLLAGALLGTALRTKLPESHLSQDSMDVIKLATGLMATLAALVLGLLISSANTARNTAASAVSQTVASVALLDRYLAAYGQDAQEARELLRHLMVRRAQVRWPAEDFGPPEPPIPSNRNEWVELERRVLHLVPRDDAQKWFQGQALQLANELALNQWLVTSQLLGNDLPMPMLIVLIVWTTAIFISFGIFARMNSSVVIALSISALSVAAAIFLILELNSPFTGLIHVSSAPSHALLQVLGN
jgi:ABC-type multidrug transport system fused ATPase/permease subunit